MHIQFHKVRWKNLLSTGNDYISVDLDKHGMTLIIGKNGQGKSQLLDAICFALFNRAFRDINKPQLVNSINKKNLVVDLAFTVGNHSYVVRRGIKPNLFEIYRDGKLIPEDSETGDYQEYLEKQIIRMNFKTFTQVNILGKASYIPFMQLKPQHRREVVEDLLDSQIYSKMHILAKKELKDKGDEYRDLQSRIEIVKNKISTHQMLMQRRNDDKQKRIDEINENITKTKQFITEWQNELSRFDQLYKKIQGELEEIAKDPDKIQSALMELTANLASLNNTRHHYQNQISKIDFDVCPTCNQKMDEDHKKHIIEENTSKIGELAEKIELLKSRKEKVEQLSSQYHAKLTEMREVSTNWNSVKQKIENFKEMLTNFNKQLETIENTEEVKVDAEELTTLNNELNELKENYNSVVKEIDVLKKCVGHLGDDGIKAKIVNKYIPTINTQINHYLTKMDLFAEFELDEQFNETIKSRYRDTFTYESFSEGEKLRINLALLLSWRYIAQKRNSVSTNLMIFDEVLDGSFDSDGIRDFMKILTELVKAQNIFIISHNPEVIEGFDNVIVAEKIGNFTEYRSI